MMYCYCHQTGGPINGRAYNWDFMVAEEIVIV